MKLFNGILGVFAFFAAMYCFFYPGLTFLNAGWMVTVLLLGWGACALFETVTNRGESKPGKDVTVKGIIALGAGAIACTASVLAISKPLFSLITDAVIVYTFLGWIFLSGIFTVLHSVTVGRKTDGKRWIVGLVLGILTFLAGLYGVCHILLTAWSMTKMFGIIFIVYSGRLLASVFE